MSSQNRDRLKNGIPIFVLLVTQLHLLRNVFSVYYALLLLTFVISIWFVIANRHSIGTSERHVLYFILAIYSWPIVAMLPSIFSGTYNGFGDIGIGLARLIFSLPIYLVLVCSSCHKESIFKLLTITALISMVAALSIPYQFIFGAIPWFADNSERSGLLRFASLFGSLTALGIVCGYGVLAAAVSIKSTFFKILVIVGIILGSILSLQKAAIGNILIAFGAILLIQKPNLKDIFKTALIFSPVAFLFGFYFFEEINQYLLSIRLNSNDSSSFSDDVSILESIGERLVENPAVAINYHGIESLLFGLGPIGGSGAFGYVDVPMSHNGMVDILLVGGVPYLFILLAFFLFVLKAAAKKVGNEDFRKIRLFGLVVFFASIVNMLFSGLIIFAPSNAMFLAIALRCIFAPNRLELKVRSHKHMQ